MDIELERRATDLARRAEKYATCTATGFLNPAQQQELRSFAAREREITMVLHGGAADCERCVAFFLPPWQEPETLCVAQTIGALHLTAAFGQPGHRDYLGALLALGIRRECLGDLRVVTGGAYLFCLCSMTDYLIANLEKAGRVGLKLMSVALEEVPPLIVEREAVCFTVQSPRLDSVCAGLFRLSRTAAAALIVQGAASVNALPCIKPDALLRPGDVISLRGYGKGTLSEAGGLSRKGRQFLRAERWK